ncbi:hypothetical protein SAV14893_082500 [Streptomyces avermitilis]|uniref:Uncharacterized protein n=1 Tax=Streptomyces avermitilis TaxID=33903 RepID=A0A4D4MFJ7_STRAX|nr:hypothetical protein SAV14893_082500 [Streptomyces avermitilis]GDY70761.1 hypothetical protein SAV31267_002460 [Streptomyces avermitilis]
MRQTAKNSRIARGEGRTRSPKSPRWPGRLNGSTGDSTTAPYNRWISPAYLCSRNAKYASILLIFARTVARALLPGPAKYRSNAVGVNCHGTTS